MVNRFNVDQAVEARWGGGGGGTVVFELSEEEGGPEWTYSIAHDDGDTDERVLARNVRLFWVIWCFVLHNSPAHC